MRCPAHTTNLSATPGRPACPSRASGWSSLTTPWGFPSCAFLVYMPPPIPRCSSGAYSSLSSPSHFSLPRYGSRVGLHIVLFEACSAFTRVAACTLALSPILCTLIEGFSHFVTSMTAPIASGWSESPGGACTHWKAPPCHGAHPKQPLVHVRLKLVSVPPLLF